MTLLQKLHTPPRHEGRTRTRSCPRCGGELAIAPSSGAGVRCRDCGTVPGPRTQRPSWTPVRAVNPPGQPSAPPPTPARRSLGLVGAGSKLARAILASLRTRRAPLRTLVPVQMDVGQPDPPAAVRQGSDRTGHLVKADPSLVERFVGPLPSLGGNAALFERLRIPAAVTAAAAVLGVAFALFASR